MRSPTLAKAAILLVVPYLVDSQTFTSCNPLSNSCPADPALGTTINTDFTQGPSSDWVLDYETLSYGNNGAEFTINIATDAPTISSAKYIFFGKITVTTRASPGSGMVSSFILQSDDLDEIDWEWLGSNDGEVETNFFGKGNTTTYDRAIYYPVTDPVGTWHTYTIEWTSAFIKWSIDSIIVRTLLYTDPLALEGQNFPQTPMRVKMGNWVGCASQAATTSPATAGTCQWAGGVADFSKAPFTMYVKSVTVQDYSCGSDYAYGDESGSWQSLQIIGACNGQHVSSISVASSTSVSPTLQSTISSSSSALVQSLTSTTSRSSSSTSKTTTSTALTAETTVATTTVGFLSGASTTTSSGTAQTSKNVAIDFGPRYSYALTGLSCVVLGWLA